MQNYGKDSRFYMKGLRARIISLLTGPPALAFIPAISLAAFWFGGEGALLVVAALAPAAYLLSGGLSSSSSNSQFGNSSHIGPLPRAQMVTRCEEVYVDATRHGQHSCIQVLEIEGFADLVDRFGATAGDTVIQRMAERLISVMRDGDIIGQIGDARFAICVSPVRQLSLDLCIQLAGRLQAAAEEPTSIDGTVIYADVCIGFCQHSRAPDSRSGQ